MIVQACTGVPGQVCRGQRSTFKSLLSLSLFDSRDQARVVRIAGHALSQSGLSHLPISLENNSALG